MTFFRPRQVLHANGLWFEVLTNSLGAVGQTDLVGLKALSQNNGSDSGGKAVDEMYVPSAVLEAALDGGAALYERVGEAR